MDNVWSLLGVLAVVILILYLAYYASKWVGTHGISGVAPAAIRTGGAGKLRILAQVAVGRNERLVLAQAGERCYLLGVTEHQITLLRELDDEEAATWLEERENAQPPGFTQALGAALRKKK